MITDIEYYKLQTHIKEETKNFVIVGKFDLWLFNTLCLIFLQFPGKYVSIEKALQLFISTVNAQLFKTVHLKPLKSSHVQ